MGAPRLLLRAFVLLRDGIVIRHPARSRSTVKTARVAPPTASRPLPVRSLGLYARSRLVLLQSGFFKAGRRSAVLEDRRRSCGGLRIVRPYARVTFGDRGSNLYPERRFEPTAVAEVTVLQSGGNSRARPCPNIIEGRSASLCQSGTRGWCSRRRSWPAHRPALRPGSPPGLCAIGERSIRCADSPSPTSCCRRR